MANTKTRPKSSKGLREDAARLRREADELLGQADASDVAAVEVEAAGGDGSEHIDQANRLRGRARAKSHAADRSAAAADSAAVKELQDGIRKQDRADAEEEQNIRASIVADLETLEELTDGIGEVFERCLRGPGRLLRLRTRRRVQCALAGIPMVEVEDSIPDSALVRLSDLESGKVREGLQARINAAIAAAHNANGEAQSWARIVGAAIQNPDRGPYDVPRWDAALASYRSLPDDLLEDVGPQLRERMSVLREKIVTAVRAKAAPGGFDRTEKMPPVPEA